VTMPTNIGFNINDEQLPLEALLADIERLDCGWVLVATTPQQANAIAAARPDTLVIYRAQWFPDETPQDFCSRVTPEQYIEQMLALDLDPDILWSALYEPANYALVADWLIDVMNRADRIGRRLVVGNFAAGTPAPMHWRSSLRPLLERLAGSWHILGMHETIMGDLKMCLRQHMARCQIVKDACATLGLARPRLMITDHCLSLDDVGSESQHNPEILAQLLWETCALHALCDVVTLVNYEAILPEVIAVLAALEWPELVGDFVPDPPAAAWQPVLATPQQDRVNVRARPHTGWPELAIICDPVLAECIDTGHPWWRIRYGGISGWIHTDHVQFETAASPAMVQGATPDQRIAHLETENTALRVENRDLRIRLEQIADMVIE
ncbi:hypothetical protein ACFLYO_08120, partial [Chloroflexota bacterium]